MNLKKLLAEGLTVVYMCGTISYYEDLPENNGIVTQTFAVESTSALPSATEDFSDLTKSEFHIKNVSDFIAFAEANKNQSFDGKTIYLDGDIDMKDIEYKSSSFSGLFDGQYHTIRNLKIEESESYGDCYAGLFSKLYGTVVRLNLENYNVTAQARSEGSLYPLGTSPSSDWDFWIEYGEVGIIRGYNYDGYAGGICGVNNGRIYGCTVNGKSYVSYSYNPATLPSPYNYDYGVGKYTGGICAVNNGAIKYCSSSQNLYEDNFGIVLNCEPDYQWTHEEVDMMDFTCDIDTLGELIVSSESVEIFEGLYEIIDVKLSDCHVNADCISQDTNIATVTNYSNGYYKINGESAGDTQIKVKYGSQVKYVDVHVSEMGELVVSPEKISIAEGESQQINVIMNNAPVNASCYVIDSDIAEVNDNIVKGKSRGKTQIKVTFGNQTKYIDVNIYADINQIPANDFSDDTLNEYRITNSDGMLAFAKVAGSLRSDATVYLDADIDMTGKGYESPDNFYGTFDGRYHTIRGLTDYSSYDSGLYYDEIVAGGLFKTLRGIVLRVNLENVSVRVVGCTYYTPSYEVPLGNGSSEVHFDIKNYDGYAGGICGVNYGGIYGCTVTGNVYGEVEIKGYLNTSFASYHVDGICGTGYVDYCSSNAVKNELNSGWTRNEVDKLYPCKYPLKSQGDVNNDGKFSIADVVTLQKWLLAESDVTLDNWRSADYYVDLKIDVFDLVMMKKDLIQQK